MRTRLSSLISSTTRKRSRNSRPDLKPRWIGDRQQKLRDAEAGFEQQHRDDRRGDHEQCIEDVVAGDDARAVRGLRTGLDQGIERDDVETAEQADQHQVPQHAMIARVAQEGCRTEVADLRGHRCGEVQVDAEDGQADRTQRYQAHLHLVSGKALA